MIRKGRMEIIYLSSLQLNGLVKYLVYGIVNNLLGNCYLFQFLHHNQNFPYMLTCQSKTLFSQNNWISIGG